MHFAVAVVGSGILLQTVGYDLVVDHHRLVGGSGLLYDVENVQQFAGVTACVAEKCILLLHHHVARGENRVFGDGAVQ